MFTKYGRNSLKHDLNIDLDSRGKNKLTKKVGLLIKYMSEGTYELGIFGDNLLVPSVN